MDETYHFDEQSYANLAEAGVRPTDVVAALRGRHRFSRQTGAVLDIVGPVPGGGWLRVAVIPTEPEDEHLVHSARPLTPEEIAGMPGQEEA